MLQSSIEESELVGERGPELLHLPLQSSIEESEPRMIIVSASSAKLQSSIEESEHGVVEAETAAVNCYNRP